MFVNILTLFRFYIGLCTRRSFHSKMYTMTTQYISTQYLGTFKSLRNTCTYITKLLYKQVLTTTGKSCSLSSLTFALSNITDKSFLFCYLECVNQGL